MIKKLAPTILRVVIGALFTYAAIGKLTDLHSFEIQIAKLTALPQWTGELLALYLPWLEIVCGLALIAGRMRAGATTLIVTMLIAFEIVLLRAWLAGIEADCGCFGNLFGSSSVQMAFFRNIILLAITAWILRHEIELHSSQRRCSGSESSSSPIF